jgi:hypothetical protein
VGRKAHDLIRALGMQVPRSWPGRLTPWVERLTGRRQKEFSNAGKNRLCRSFETAPTGPFNMGQRGRRRAPWPAGRLNLR